MSESESIYDIAVPDWATLNEDGIWCNFCGDLMVAPWQAEDGIECPDGCPTCGAPDDGEMMAEYFT